MWTFFAGPWNTISFSCSVSSRKGTFVRTPILPAMSFISDHMSVCQGSTAPSSMESESSPISVASSTVRTMPVPSQRGHAPVLLNDISSAEGAKNVSSHTGQVSGSPAATFMEGGA